MTFYAHGVGGRQDLPIPFSFALVGGVMAVGVSFLALGVLWKHSRLRGDAAGRALPAGLARTVDHPAVVVGLRVAGLALAGFVALAAWFGPDDNLNPTARFVYVLFWVGLVPASLLLGPVWRALNPLRTIHLGLTWLIRVPASDGLWPLPARLGYWPAAVSLLAFTWLELAAPDRDSTVTLRSWFGIYGAVHLVAATAFGSGWFDRGDGFEAYSTLVGRFSPFGRRADGALVRRNPFDGLDGLPAAPGLVALVSVLLGSTAFDGLASSPSWFAATQSVSLPTVLVTTLGLLTTIGLVAATYSAAAGLAGVFGTSVPAGNPGANDLVRERRWISARRLAPGWQGSGSFSYWFGWGRFANTARRDARRRVPGGDRAPSRKRSRGMGAGSGTSALPLQFAHSIVPLAIGYVIAHYFSLFVFEGQRALIQASDPLGRGVDLFGTATRGVDYAAVSALIIALVQISAIVIAHVTGVVAAHDRAVRLFPRGQAIAGQLPLLVLMICYTLTAILLLFPE